jgi:hypothetical protein
MSKYFSIFAFASYWLDLDRRPNRFGLDHIGLNSSHINFIESISVELN